MTRDQSLKGLCIAYAEAYAYAETLPHGSAERSEWTRRANEYASFIRTDMGIPAVPLNPDSLWIIRYALGHDPRRPRSGGGRNLFASNSANAINLVESLVVSGFMEWGAPYRDTRYAHVTEAGARAAGCLSAYFRHQKKAGS